MELTYDPNGVELLNGIRSSHLWTSIALALFSGALLLPSNAEAKRKKKPRKKRASSSRAYQPSGSTRTRFGLGASTLRTVTVDENGQSKDETSLGLTARIGVSHAATSRLVLDGDLAFLFGFTPDIDLVQVEMTPGARFFLDPRFYLRSAYVVRLKDPTNQLFLLGGGYYLTRGSLSLFAELNYVAWSKEEVDTRIVPRVGLEARF